MVAETDAAVIVENGRQLQWCFKTKMFVDLGIVRCLDDQIPDGPVCPKCGGERVCIKDGFASEWVHTDVKWVKE